MSAANEFAKLAYEAVLRRPPTPSELSLVINKMTNGDSPGDVLARLLNSKEAQRYKSRLFVPPGHFYSPVVDTQIIAATFPRVRPTPPSSLPDVDIDLDGMTRFWQEQIAPISKTATFSAEPDGLHRYHYNNPAYSYADGTILRAMICLHRPKRIIEVGSGWSSACILDTVDECKLDTEITFIEPNLRLLQSVMREEDVSRVAIIESGVQSVPLVVFETLERNDILFIDSTHVVKTGSDVVYELAQILPRLQSGVIIHFHDIFYPFEYPYKWVVEQNRSWNEIYAVRNFLAFNNQFKVLFFNDMFYQLRRRTLELDCPDFLKNSGGALWLHRVG